jgi:LPS export ABC transporter protein LptC
MTEDSVRQRRRRRSGHSPWAVLLTSVTLIAGSAACRDSGRDAVAAVQEAADSADQLMIGLTQYMTNQGVRQAFLQADSGFIYENSGHIELKKIRVTFFAQTGAQTSVLTGREGTYNMRTGQMEARGDVLVVMTNGAHLTTSVLRYDQSKNEVSTDQHYVYEAPDRHIEGDAFVSDPSFDNIVTQRPRGTAGRFTLPGQ